MLTASAPPLQEWREFFAIIGTAAATLIGAMFVVVRSASGYSPATTRRQPAPF
jgi:hypothetical protein